MSIDNIVWAEKYRPRTLDEAILPEGTKTTVRDALDNGNIPHFLFCGGAGTGKTTLARIIANENEADLLFVNASLEGVDAVRQRVVQFASTVSFSGGLKFVLLDEFDGASPAQQQSMRGVIEEFPNTRFLFTCNFKNKVIDAIHSRCVVIDFKATKAESPKLQMKFFKRILTILDTENVKYDKPVVAELVKKFYPDFRRTLNELQRYSSSGSIDSGILVNHDAAVYEELLSAVKKKNFDKMRAWVGENSDIEFDTIFKMFYDSASELLKPECIPSIVMVLAEYQYKASMVADPEILVAACMTEIMPRAVWK
jgi:DNA polymerase III delta prime subunit